jgi:hypothetical protein
MISPTKNIVPYYNIDNMAQWKTIIRNYKLSFSVLLFLISFLIVHHLKPNLVYTPDGGFREFGVGYKNKTVIPIWVVAIILAIFSYLAIVSFLLYS